MKIFAGSSNLPLAESICNMIGIEPGKIYLTPALNELLVRAESVSVVGVGDEVSSERLDAVATHLRSHGAKAQYLHLPNTAGDACSSLLEQAGRERSDLIVTGVFGRNSLAERVFGGVTTEMLRSTEICWFMSH